MTNSLKFMESLSFSWFCVKDYEMELHIPMNALEMARWDKAAGRCIYENQSASLQLAFVIFQVPVDIGGLWVATCPHSE